MNMDFAAARRHMVDCQIRPNKVTDERLIEILETLPRERFVPESRQSLAYIDEDLKITEDRYLMEPVVLARLLQALCEGRRDNAGGVALVVGCGAGYSAAVLGHLYDMVFALESDGGLAAEATKLMSDLAMDNVVVQEGPLNEGWAKEAPFDAIFIDGCVEEIPESIVSQLANGGKLATICKSANGLGHAVLKIRNGDASSQRELFDASVPLLKEFNKEAGFVF